MNSNRLFRRKINIRLSQNLQLSDSAFGGSPKLCRDRSSASDVPHGSAHLRS